MTMKFFGLQMQVGIINTDGDLDLVDLETGMPLSHMTAGIQAPEGCAYMNTDDDLVRKVVKILVEEGAIVPVNAGRYAIYPMFRFTEKFSF